jgi:hypothetical protein
VSNQALWITCLIGPPAVPAPPRNRPAPCPRRPDRPAPGSAPARAPAPHRPAGCRAAAAGTHRQLPVAAARSFSTCFNGIASRSVAAVWSARTVSYAAVVSPALTTVTRTMPAAPRAVSAIV